MATDEFVRYAIATCELRSALRANMLADIIDSGSVWRTCVTCLTAGRIGLCYSALSLSHTHTHTHSYAGGGGHTFRAVSVSCSISAAATDNGIYYLHGGIDGRWLEDWYWYLTLLVCVAGAYSAYWLLCFYMEYRSSTPVLMEDENLCCSVILTELRGVHRVYSILKMY